MRHRNVGGPMQTHRPHRLEVRARQFAQGSAFAEPGRAIRVMIGPTAAVRAFPWPTVRHAPSRPSGCGAVPGSRRRYAGGRSSGSSAGERYRGVLPREQRGGNAPGVRLQRQGWGDIGDRGIRPVRSSSMRQQSIVHWLCMALKCRPRLSRVRCRT